MKELRIFILFILVINFTNTSVDLVDLKSLAKKEDLKYQRSLSLGGFVTLSKKMNTLWGSQVLNQHFNQERNSKGFSSERPLSYSPVNLMDLSDQVFDFLSKHSIQLKKEAGSNDKLDFILHNPKLSDSQFKVQIDKADALYNIKFGSKEPYISKTLKMTSNENNFKDKLKAFLEKNFTIWKKFIPRKLKLTNKVNIISKKDSEKERKLFNLENLQSVLNESLTENLEVRPIEGEEQKWELLLKEGERKIADVYIENEEEKFPLLYVSNLEIPMFKHMKKFSCRGILTQDDTESVLLFVKAEFEEFETQAEAYFSARKTTKDVANIVLKVGEESFKEGMAIKSEVVGEDAENPDLVFVHDNDEGNHLEKFEGIIYKISDEFIMLEMNQGTNDMQIQVPVLLNEEQQVQTELAIRSLLLEKAYENKVGFNEAVDIFKESLSLTSCNKLDSSIDIENLSAFIGVDGNDDCAFKDEKVVIVGIKVGEEVFLHIVLNNKYFKGEHIITLTSVDQFRRTTHRIITNSQIQFKQADEAFKESQEPMSINFESIVATIEEELKNKVQLDKKRSNDDVKVFEALNGDKLQTLIKVVKKTTQIVLDNDPENPEEIDLFKFMIYDISAHDNSETPKVHKEFLLYGENGYNQLDILKKEMQDLDSHLKEIS